MKDELDILNRIEKVEPPEQMLSGIYDRLAQRAQNKVSSSWLGAIAAAFALLLVAETYLLTNQGQGHNPAPKALTQILPHQQNTLYDE
jgi:hypothetical protein